MFKRLCAVAFATLMFSFGLMIVAGANPEDNRSPAAIVNLKKIENEHILLTPENTVTLRGPVNRLSANVATYELMRLSAQLPKDQPLYLVLDTPGGDVDAGWKLVSQVKAMKREVKTITLTSASMGFLIVQALGERLAVQSSYFMSHQPTVTVRGQLRGNFLPTFKQYSQFLELVEKTAALRMGLTLSQYYNLVQNEYRVYGEKAIQDRVADRMVKVECSEELLNGRQQILLNDGMVEFFGIYSACPLIQEMVDAKPL